MDADLNVLRPTPLSSSAIDARRLCSLFRVFDASHVASILQDVREEERGKALESMVMEAEARERDPVFGSMGTICDLLQRIEWLRSRLVETERGIRILQSRFPHVRPTHKDDLDLGHHMDDADD
eukprot:TRINITY_DN1999_c0_g1_i1.p1 TRINITY_DN1999_c0_g1~~TRINITY_DN1999_c0_g1_i1.p1  ORF type:complete len:124 (+),score=14.23 TRINITY_DN1999_c0_g1_i1:81-452(+)